MRLNSHRFKSAVLTGLLLAWPLFVSAETPPPAGTLQVSRTVALDPEDPLHRWFKQQDTLLDEILMRLARIEALVRDLHRLISGMPESPAAANTPPPHPAMTASPLPPPKAPVPAPPVLADWAIPAAGSALLVLLLLDWRRRRSAAAAPTAVPAVSPAPAPPVAMPPAHFEPPPAPVLPPVVVAASIAAAPAVPNAKDPSIELAEIMLSMGLGHGAAQTLVEQIRREPRQALAQWLKLLEIYRQNEQQEEFERSAEELRQHFNVKPADWHAPTETQHTLEDYPHIAARTIELWRKPACLTYLQNLLDDNRGGSRSGFPQSVAEELLLLTALLKSDR